MMKRLVAAALVMGLTACGGDLVANNLAGSCNALETSSTSGQSKDDIFPTTQALSQDGTGRFIVHFKTGADPRVPLAGFKPLRHLQAYNASIVSLSPQAAAQLAKSPQVLKVEEDAVRTAFAQSQPSGMAQIQATLAWSKQLPSTRGVKTCIIDSGIHLSHEDIPKTNITGFPEGEWNVDRCGHGTHVAGTIAAVDNNLGVVGIVRNGLDLVIVKIFDDDCKQTRSSDLASAVDQCINAGARVINMSLGGDRPTDLEREAFDRAWRRGALMIAAAGNDGSTSQQYPASYASVISVAATQTVADGSLRVAGFSQKNAQVDLAAPGTSIVSTVPFESRQFVAVQGARVLGSPFQNAASTSGRTGTLVYGGLCGAASSQWSGKIVLCLRGGYSFNQKATEVQKAGALGMVIFNNETGTFSGTLGSSGFTISALAVSQENGLWLKDRVGTTVTLVSEELRQGNGYSTMSGTSMAAPHVSGVAALVWGEFPHATNAHIRAALEATALDLGDAGRDDASGMGLVQAQAAIAYLSAQLPSDVPPQAAFSVKCVGMLCAFTSTSIDSDGSVMSWRFDLGDGTIAYGASAMHQFKTAGPFPVKLTVTDNHGLVGQVTIPVSVIDSRLIVSHDSETSTAKLTWSGVSEDAVVVLRNGEVQKVQANSGDWEEEFDTQKLGPAYQVCTRSMESCSDARSIFRCN